MAKKSNAERCREYRQRKKVERQAAKGAEADVEARREAARERYQALKSKGGRAYKEMLAAAKVRAAAYHERVRAAREGR